MGDSRVSSEINGGVRDSGSASTAVLILEDQWDDDQEWEMGEWSWSSVWEQWREEFPW